MDVFEALAAPTRREIIEMLSSKGRLSATDIYQRFDASPPAISQHLKILREAKLVRVERQGQLRIYQIDPQGLAEIEEWSQRMTRIWNKRFDALEKVLQAEKEKMKTRTHKERKQ
jgi:DNA-binding transcriptional ArsR family regulator